MKKIDKLIIGSFFGPFFLTFFVVIFILLSQFMLKYLDEIVGKDLDTTVIIQLIFYFSIFMTPNAFPLAVLLSSLMTFGNLGEHFELTALKGSGISLIRVMVPIFVFTLALSATAYYSNNNIVPKANLKAFSLLYDVKQMKPSMELKEGSFYNGIEGYSIKVGEKYPDGKSLKDLIIYNHTERRGNKQVTMADSGQMYNILNDRYLVLEMFNGNTYSEQVGAKKNYTTQKEPDPLVRSEFKAQKVVFSLASFDLTRTKEELFSSNRLMKDAAQLGADVDSMKISYLDKTEEVKENSFRFFDYHLQDIVSIYKQQAVERELRNQSKEDEKERLEQERINEKERLELKKTDSLLVLDKSISSKDTIEQGKANSSNRKEVVRDKSNPNSSALKKAGVKKSIPKSLAKNIAGGRKFEFDKKKDADDKSESSEEDSVVVKPTFEENMITIDSLINSRKIVKSAFTRSLTHVRHVKNNVMMQSGQLDKLKAQINKFQLERYKKLSYAITILIMFFIGAPLGAIIKRGGLGVPVLISLSFFILFYVISMMCEKWTRIDVMDPLLSAWMANIILFPIGLFFMKQAKNDARLFDTDFYSVVFLKIRLYFFSLSSKFNKNK